MIRLILFSVLFSCIIAATIKEKKSKNSFQLVIDIEAPDCGCDNESEEDLCLDTKNSKKIIDALLYIIKKNNYSYEVLKAYKIIPFMSNQLTYAAFASNIKHNDFPNYKGAKKLKSLVKKYKVCKKVCKVYFELRKALREHSTNAKIVCTAFEDGNNKCEISATLLISCDFLSGIQDKFYDDPSVNQVHINATTLVINEDMNWKTISVSIEADVAIVPVPCDWHVYDLTVNVNQTEGWKENLLVISHKLEDE